MEPIFVHCADWNEFTAIARVSQPQPKELLFAYVDPEDASSRFVTALWKDGDRFHWSLAHVDSDERRRKRLPEISYRDEGNDGPYWRIRRYWIDDNLARLGISSVSISDPAMIAAFEHALKVMEADMAKSGLFVHYLVSCHHVHKYEGYTSTEAIYDNVETALAHASIGFRAATKKNGRQTHFYHVEPVPFRKHTPSFN
jgi:hypothetical protein